MDCILYKPHDLHSFFCISSAIIIGVMSTNPANSVGPTSQVYYGFQHKGVERASTSSGRRFRRLWTTPDFVSESRLLSWWIP